MKYFKRRWEECRADRHAAWGHSWWFFETDEDGTVLRQIEVYDSGPTMRYHDQNPEDSDGMLAAHRLQLAEFQGHEITQDEFLEKWK